MGLAQQRRRRVGGRSEETHSGERGEEKVVVGRAARRRRENGEREREKVGEGGISEGGRKRGRMRRERGRPPLYLSAANRMGARKDRRKGARSCSNHFASTLQAAPGYRRRGAACARYPRPTGMRPGSTPEAALRQVALSCPATSFPLADALARLRVCLPLLLFFFLSSLLWHQPSLINPHGSPMSAEAVQRQFPL
jgi:hypothetical protein